MKISSIEQELRDHGSCIIQTVGTSMEPMLLGRRSSVLLIPPKHPLSPGDVALFRRADGNYVLHRVIRLRKADYLIRGDNCLETEAVAPAQIIGVMSGFWREDAYAASTDKGYLRYVRTLPCRYALRRCRAFAGRFRQKRGFL